MSPEDDEERLPPFPDDEWGRFLGWIDGWRDVWVRPRHLVERHPAIQLLHPTEALVVLGRWARDDFGRIERIHRRAFGRLPDVDAENLESAILGRIEDEVRAGRLVLHAAQRREAPGQRPSPSVRPAPERPKRPEPQRELTWIEIALVDEAGHAVAEEPVLIVDPSGARQTISTGEQGVARLGGIDPGVCDVSFPRIDGREWARKGTGFPSGTDAIARVHPVQARECMSRIAFRHAFRSGDTLWNHDVNAELRDTGRDPDVLWPGDRVNILVRDDRDEHAETGRRHPFVVKTSVRLLQLVLHDVFRKPLASVPYVLELPGRPARSDTTGADGQLEEIIPPWVTEGVVTAGDLVWHLAIADLRPVEHAPDGGEEGVLRRLRNLGCPASRDAATRRSTAAQADTEGEKEESTGAFDADVFMHQERVGWRTSGELDTETRARVIDEFGV